MTDTPDIYTVRDLIGYLQQFNPESRVYDIDGMSIIPPQKTTPVPDSTTTCTRCGQFITLVPFGQHYKYVNVTRLNEKIWKCMPTVDHPVRSHEPATQPQQP